MKNIKYVKIMIMVSTLLCQINLISVYGQLVEAQSSYDVAENSITILSSYIIDLSKSNQDIDKYIKGVNEAIEELQLAETAILNEKYVTSIPHSREANQIAIEMINEIAENRAQQTFVDSLSTQAGLLIQTVLISIFFFVLWGRITTKYHTKILKSQPKVTYIES